MGTLSHCVAKNTKCLLITERSVWSNPTLATTNHNFFIIRYQKQNQVDYTNENHSQLSTL